MHSAFGQLVTQYTVPHLSHSQLHVRFAALDEPTHALLASPHCPRLKQLDSVEP